MHGDPLIWRHVVLSTKGRWLHGDPQGFRSRDHRIHSSGTSEYAPVPGEHKALHEYHQARSATAVRIAADLRRTIADTFAAALVNSGWRVRVVSLTDAHLHALAKLPADKALTKQIVGDAKRISSRSVKRELPGSIWSEGGSFEPVWDYMHNENVFSYILDHRNEGAYIWHDEYPLPQLEKSCRETAEAYLERVGRT